MAGDAVNSGGRLEKESANGEINGGKSALRVCQKELTDEPREGSKSTPTDTIDMNPVLANLSPCLPLVTQAARFKCSHLRHGALLLYNMLDLIGMYLSYPSGKVRLNAVDTFPTAMQKI